MALRKFLFQSSEGYTEEQATADSLNLGALTMGGAIAMGTNKITGLGAATTANDALAYGQSGALLAGLALSGGNLDLSGLQKVVNSTAPTAATDLVTKAYVDTLVVTGGQIKEAIFDTNQLSSAQGIAAAGSLYFLAQPVVGDTVVFKNTTLTRTYTFVANIGAEAVETDVSIESSALTALQRLVVRIMADTGNTQWNIYDLNNSERITPSAPSGHVTAVVDRTSGAGVSSSRIYGTFTTANDAKVVEFASGAGPTTDLDYTRTAAVTMATVDPGAGRFGFRRQASALVDGEIHFELHLNNMWAWNSDTQTWNVFASAGSGPDATSGPGGGTKGKITVDEDFALFVVAGVLKMALLSTGGLQFNAGSPKTLGIKNNTTGGLTTDASGEKILLDGASLATGASGAKVNFDTTRGLNADGSGLYLALATNPGLEFNGTTGLQTKIFSTGGLQRDTNGLSIKNDPAGGLASTVAGEKANLEAVNPTLKVAGSNELGVKYDTTKGLNTSAAGLIVKVDGATISFDGGGNLQTTNVAEAKRIENTINVDTAVVVGAPVYITATGDRVAPGDTDTDTKARIVGIARTAQASVGSSSEIVEVGRCDGVLAGATPGVPYYLATGGGMAPTTPGAGKRVIQVGVALNATDLMVRIVDYGKKAA